MNSINDYYKIRNCNMDLLKLILIIKIIVEEVKMIFSLIVKFGKFNL